MTRVFVYGSLRRGEPNHRLLARARFVGEVRTEPAFTLVDLGYFPGLIEVGETAVTGEVYEIDAAIRAALDRLEGHPHFYERRIIRLEDGSDAEAYLLGPSHMEGRPIVASGDWRGREDAHRDA